MYLDPLWLTDTDRIASGEESRKRSCVRPSVCLSVCLSHHATAAATCGEFAAERRAGGRY